MGAQVIKIVVDAQRYQYSVEDIRFIVEEARRAGVKVAAHAQTQKGARAAIEAGVASIEHGWVLSDEDLQLAKRNGVVLVSTDFPVDELVAGGIEPGRAAALYATRVDRLRRAYAAGVSVVFGTDVMTDVPGRTRGQASMAYVDSFKDADVPAYAILRAMTIDGAELLGIADERGSIAIGKAADIVAVNENPLSDIDAIKAMDFVMRDGRVFVQHGRPNADPFSQ